MRKFINRIVAVLMVMVLVVGMFPNYGFVANAETSESLGKITGAVNWVDADNMYNIRPENVTVKLYADDELVDEVIASAENGWSYSFDISKL